jgi:hypothetical protein
MLCPALAQSSGVDLCYQLFRSEKISGWRLLFCKISNYLLFFVIRILCPALAQSSGVDQAHRKYLPPSPVPPEKTFNESVETLFRKLIIYQKKVNQSFHETNQYLLFPVIPMLRYRQCRSEKILCSLCREHPTVLFAKYF